MKSKLKLTDREWREFFLEEVTQIHNGVRLTKADMVAGSRPFIGASEASNGVTGFVENSNASLDKEVLGVNYNGSVGHAFYHPYRALFSDDVKRIRWKNREANNKYTLLYLAAVIAQQRGKYAYGYKFNAQRMKRQIIMLPITSEGNPDWAFMEAYMRQVEDELLAETLPKLEQQLLDNIMTLGALEDREWKEFVFGDLFTITSTSSSIDKKRLSSNKGDNPYITRSENDNGIDSFVEEQSSYAMDEGNVITIGLDTQTVFYQSHPFYTGQNIQIVRHAKLNKHNALFIIRAIKVLVQKFSWGSCGATLTRLRRGKLYLPIGMDGSPDWEFMSAFMKHVEREILRKTLMRFKSRHVIKG